MKSSFRYLLAALCLVGAVLIVSYMQFRFDQSDLRYAVQAVRSSHPNGGKESLEQMVSRVYGVPAEQLRWEPTIRSKWKGVVEVRVLDSKGEGRLAWEVDVVRFSIIPLNEESRHLGKPNE